MPKSDSTTDLQGYATVADRITLFYREYPAGRINTELVSRVAEEITFKAAVYRDGAETVPAATGWASEREGDGDINTVACLENTETSAIGRALANLGFTASSRRPSREEMDKAARARRRLSLATQASAASRAAVSRPGDNAALQAAANAAFDVLGLVHAAERRGLSAERAQVIRTGVNRLPALPLARIARVEARLRAWLRRAEAGGVTPWSASE
ncbi:MAG: hypothetical protein JWM95_64 [Gemmatimonadetes bacterium]|nr:hypothetical protein [Gemmatimonadota bacterium]